MKPLAKRLLALASAAAITLTTIPAVHSAGFSQEQEVQSWSRLQPAAPEEQIPAADRAEPAEAPLTRLGAAQLVMEGYRRLTGVTDEELGECELMFLDTEDTDVLNASKLALISGDGAGHYDPMEPISRQDFFTSCSSLLEQVGYPYIDDIVIDLEEYPDGSEVLAYASQPVQALLCLEILEPSEEGMLEPVREITLDEAMETLERLVSFYTEWELDPREPQRYLGEDVAAYALNYVGCRYVSGGKGPSKFDCSGFVYYVYKQFGYDLKPGARNQWSILDESVKKEDLLPGDLLFFSRRGRIFHVGIYIGDGQFVHAANSRKGVIVTDIDDPWYANRYCGAKRAIG